LTLISNLQKGQFDRLFIACKLCLIISLFLFIYYVSSIKGERMRESHKENTVRVFFNKIKNVFYK